MVSLIQMQIFKCNVMHSLFVRRVFSINATFYSCFYRKVRNSLVLLAAELADLLLIKYELLEDSKFHNASKWFKCGTVAQRTGIFSFRMVTKLFDDFATKFHENCNLNALKWFPLTRLHWKQENNSSFKTKLVSFMSVMSILGRRSFVAFPSCAFYSS